MSSRRAPEDSPQRIKKAQRPELTGPSYRRRGTCCGVTGQRSSGSLGTGAPTSSRSLKTSPSDTLQVATGEEKVFRSGPSSNTTTSTQLQRDGRTSQRTFDETHVGFGLTFVPANIYTDFNHQTPSSSSPDWFSCSSLFVRGSDLRRLTLQTPRLWRRDSDASRRSGTVRPLCMKRAV